MLCEDRKEYRGLSNNLKEFIKVVYSKKHSLSYRLILLKAKKPVVVSYDVFCDTALFYFQHAVFHFDLKTL